MKVCAIGIDIGGTNFRIGLVDSNGNLDCFQKYASSLFQNEDGLEILTKTIKNYQNENTNNKNRKINSGEIHIHKNEYIKNEDKTQNKYHIHEAAYMDEHMQEYVGQHIYEHTHVDEHGKAHTHTHTHNPETVKNELNRIARIIGHMKSIKTMIESGRDCSEVLIQLAAVDAAIKSLSRVILKEHMSTCIVDAIKTEDTEAIEALNEAIDKFIK